MKTISCLVSCIARAALPCAVSAFLAVASLPASAAIIDIDFTGMDLVYDGSAIYDAGSTSGGSGNPADADPLTSVIFSVDNIQVATFTSDISLDIYIPDVVNISAAPNTTTPQTTPGTTAGYFDLLLGTAPSAAEYLRIDLNQVSFTYLDFQGLVQFTFGATVSSSFSQLLPDGLVIGDPVTVSFSAQVVPGTITSSGAFITGFEAGGTGEIRGPLVPEPTSVALTMISGLAALAFSRRR